MCPKITDNIKNLDIGAQVDVIYTDFAKAFDTVPHYRLLNKLKLYNISDKLIYSMDPGFSL